MKIAGPERIRSEVDELIDLGISPDLSPEALLAMEALGLEHLAEGAECAHLSAAADPDPSK